MTRDVSSNFYCPKNLQKEVTFIYSLSLYGGQQVQKYNFKQKSF